MEAPSCKIDQETENIDGEKGDMKSGMSRKRKGKYR